MSSWSAPFDCYESCSEAGDWTTKPEAWQWDVLTALDPVAALCGLLAVGLRLAGRREALLLVGLHGCVLAVAGSLLAQVSFRWDEVVFWWILIVGAGVCFAIVARSPQPAPV
jgi:hypothetical protein